MPQPQTTNQTKVQHQLMKTTETPPPSSSSSPLADQTSMISELMKKNPELFKWLFRWLCDIAYGFDINYENGLRTVVLCSKNVFSVL